MTGWQSPPDTFSRVWSTEREGRGRAQWFGRIVTWVSAGRAGTSHADFGAAELYRSNEALDADPQHFSAPRVLVLDTHLRPHGGWFAPILLLTVVRYARLRCVTYLHPVGCELVEASVRWSDRG